MACGSRTTSLSATTLTRRPFFRLNAAWAVFLIVGGAFIVVAGSYGAIAGIASTYAISPGQSFSCADNSGS